MGPVHATTQAAALGMRRVLIPRAARGLLRAGLVSADHVVDASRTELADWRQVDCGRLTTLGDSWRPQPGPS